MKATFYIFNIFIVRTKLKVTNKLRHKSTKQHSHEASIESALSDLWGHTRTLEIDLFELYFNKNLRNSDATFFEAAFGSKLTQQIF